MKNPGKTKNNPLANVAVTEENPSKESIQELYEYVQSSLNFIEAKNGVIVTLLGGLIVAILSFSMEGRNNLWLYLSIIPSAAALIPLLLSFYPVQRRRRKSKINQEDHKNSYLFRCENIAKFSKDELAHLLSGKLDGQKIEYIHSASKTIARKYRLSRISMKLLFGLCIAYAVGLAITKLIFE
ncbi:MAG: DUF5706 domain-containing protein [Dysgonamonadaceae bacterium]|jgi:hypothetical protein|nr:DUF5706 domain-containing protein [Dysgonamonadaceae bacterium]